MVPACKTPDSIFKYWSGFHIFNAMVRWHRARHRLEGPLGAQPAGLNGARDHGAAFNIHILVRLPMILQMNYLTRGWFVRQPLTDCRGTPQAAHARPPLRLVA